MASKTSTRIKETPTTLNKVLTKDAEKQESRGRLHALSNTGIPPFPVSHALLDWEGQNIPVTEKKCDRSKVHAGKGKKKGREELPWKAEKLKKSFMLSNARLQQEKMEKKEVPL